MKKKLVFPVLGLCLLVVQFVGSQSISQFIHVDQFGYLSESEKVAVISDPQVGYNGGDAYSPGSEMLVRSFDTDEIVFRGTPQIWNNGTTHDLSGDRGWWFDFSNLTTPGTYYISDPVTEERTGPFLINENPYRNVLEAAFKTFYYNRSNFSKEEPYAQSNWTDTNNFPQDDRVRSAFDQNNPASERDMSGGWFDAGDYNKYVTFAQDPLHQLLSSYEDMPEIYGDDWNIPESGDGIPDILNEIKWELDWMIKMINADGTVYIKMGSLDYDINDLAPPSVNSDPRYYAPTCSSASLSVASSFAHAAKVFRRFPAMDAFSAMLESDAILCWNRFLQFYSSSSLQTDCDDMTVKAGDADWDELTQINHAITAAIYLYDITGDEQYSNFVIENLNLSEPIMNDFWAPHQTVMLEAMLNYSTLPGADPSTINTILTTSRNAISNDWSEYFDFSDAGLYRSHAPEWVYYWGSNMTMSNIGNLCLIMEKYDVLPEANEGLRRKANELIHYFHGVNPQGIVYLSNMYQYGAERSADEIFHSWFNHLTDWDNAITSPFGPAPGFLAGGPNQGYTGNLTPPAGQPVQKSYLDYNDAFTDVSYEITEPAIYYQTAYIRFLARYVNNMTTTASEELDAKPKLVRLYPNPTPNHITIHSQLPTMQILIVNQDGKVMLTQMEDSEQIEIDISNLPNGMYFLRILNSKKQIVSVERIVKIN